MADQVTRPLFRTIVDADWREGISQARKTPNAVVQQIRRVEQITQMNPLQQKGRVRSTDLNPDTLEASILAAADVMSQIYFGRPFDAMPEHLRSRAEKLLVERARVLNAGVDEILDIGEALAAHDAAEITKSCAPAATA